MVGGISRFTNKQWKATCWHSSRGCCVRARSAALLWTDVFTCACWCLTCYFHTSGAESRATAGQGQHPSDWKSSALRSPDQTSPRRAPSHSFKTSMKSAFQISCRGERRSKTCIIVVILRVQASVSGNSPAGLPGHNQSSVRSNRETTVYEAPSVVFVRSEVCQTAFLRRHDLAEQVETLSYDSNNL